MFLFLIQLTLIAAVVPQADASPNCDRARAQAESSFRQRRDLKTHQQAELDLQRALEACATSPVRSGVERRLRHVPEEIATMHLQIALFLPRADGVGLLKGALRHLRIIDEMYPNYSQMDHVLFLLGDYSVRNGETQDATNYFRRLVATYPRGFYSVQARKRLAELSASGET